MIIRWFDVMRWIALVVCFSGAALAADGPAALTDEEVRRKVHELYAAYNDGDVDAIVASRFGFEPGFGFRTLAPRGVTALSDEQLKTALTQGLALWEYYEVGVDTLHVSLHGDVAVVWGVHTERFKAHGGEEETLAVRFSQTLRRDETGALVSLHSHRDIQSFGSDGRYLRSHAPEMAPEPAAVVEAYLTGYSDGLPAAELISSYWLPNVVIHAPATAPEKVPAETFAGLVEGFRTQVRAEGWRQNVIRDIDACLLREDLALVGVDYVRRYDDDSERAEAVVYTLNSADGWRISSVMPTQPGTTLRCSGSH